MLVSNWLQALVSRVQHRPRYNSRARRALRKRWQAVQQNQLTTVDPLEDRLMLTTTLYLDFGFGFTNNELTITDTDAANTNAPQIFGTGHTLINLEQSLINQTIDYNDNGVINTEDATLFAQEVIDSVKRTYEPFDVIVELVNSNSINDVITKLLSNGQTVGNRDAYVFVAGNDPVPPPDFGIAYLDSGNLVENVAFAFADELLGQFGASPYAVARTAAHEAGHTFGLEHISSSELPGIGGLIDAPKIIGIDQNGDNIYGDDLREFNVQNIYTRFPLELQDLAGGSQNSYDILADPNIVGLKANGPAYVTGTGAVDKIEIEASSGSTATVTVEAYQDGGLTQLIDSFSYSIDVSNGVLIEGGFNPDLIRIDATIQADFTVRGGSGGDLIQFFGNSLSGNPNGSYIIDGEDGNDTITITDVLILDSIQLTAETINLNGRSITTTGDQTYDGAAVLGIDTTLQGANVTFDGTVDAISEASTYDYGAYLTDYLWEDISSTGIALGLALDQSIEAESGSLALDFLLNYYGEYQNDIYVNAHGYATFTPNQDIDVNSFFNDIPNQENPNHLIAGWWSILDPGAGGEIYFKNMGGDPGFRYSIIQFDAVPHALLSSTTTTYDTAAPITFQIKLFESTNQIEVHYLNVGGNPPSGGGNGYAHIAGIENVDGTLGTYLYGGWGDNFLYSNAQAIRYTPTFSDPQIDLYINSTNGGTTTFNGVVGGTNALGNITTNSDGTTVLNADINLSTGHTLEFNDSVVLNSDVIISAPHTHFDSALDGAFNLTFDSTTESVTFAGAVGSSTSLGSGTGAALTINSGSVAVNNTLDTNSGIIISDLVSDITFGGDINIAAGDTTSTLSTSTIRFDNATFASAGNVTFGVTGADVLESVDSSAITFSSESGATFYVNSSITDAGANSGGSEDLITTGQGSVRLLAENTFGSVSINDGTLELGIDNVFSDSSSIIINGGTLDLSYYSDTVASVTLKSGLIWGHSGILTSLSDHILESGIVYAFLGGTVDLVKNTTGTVVLSKDSAYTGTITVNAGALNIDATLDSDVIVNAGGTLNGIGQVNGTITVAGGTIAPSLGLYSLQFDDVTFSSSSTYSVDITGYSAGWEHNKINVTDTIDLGGATLDVDLNGFNPTDANSFLIINNLSSDPITGIFNGLPEGTDVVFAGNTFQISYTGGDGNDVVLIPNMLDPTVTSIIAIDSATTNSDNVRFKIYFSEEIFGFEEDYLNHLVLTSTGSLSGASITGVTKVSVSNLSYIVDVDTGQNTGTESGTLKLDLIDNDTIVDNLGHALGGVGIGNGNFTTGEEYTIDFITPAAPVIAGISNDNGLSTSDGTTSDSFLNFYGTAEPDSTVKIRRSDTNQVLATGVTDPQGNWTAHENYLSSGTYSLIATTTDPAGNISDDTSVFVVTVDTIGDIPVFSGLSAGDSGTTGDLITNEETFTLSGTAELNSQVTLFRNGSQLGSPINVDSSGNWTLQYTASEGDGDYVFTAITTDEFANVSLPTAEFTITLDNISEAPVIVGIIDDTGIDGTNNKTQDQELTLFGTAEANSIVTIYRTDQAPLLGTATADAEGNWKFEYAQTLASGTTANPETYNFKATAADVAGNPVSGFSNILSVEIVNDSEADAEVRVDLRVVTSQTSTETNGEIGEDNGVPKDLPENAQYLNEWGSYWVEIWLSTPYTNDPGTPGIKSADIDLGYNTEFTTATEVIFGAAFSENQSATINDTTGAVTHISASIDTNITTGLGVTEHLLFARVKFEATANDQVTFELDERIEDIPNGTLTRKVVTGEPEFDVIIHSITNDSNPSLVLVPNAGAEIGELPTTEIIPNIFDYNDDDAINFRDLVLFINHYGNEITSSSDDDEKWEYDVDQSGTVNFRDLVAFINNYGKSKSGSAPVSFPPNYFESWANSVSIIETQASAFVISNTVVNEETNTVTIEVTNTQQLTTGASIDVETTGTPQGYTFPESATDETDFDTFTGTLNFAGNAGEKQYITVPLHEDNIVEYDELVFVGLSNLQYEGDGYINFSNAQVVITNDDSALINISDVTQSENGTFSFEVTLDNPASETVSVRASLNHGTTDVSDFLSTSDQIIYFAPGQTSKTVTFSLADDAIAEGTESFSVTLSDPKFDNETDLTRVDISDGTGVGTINDNDAAQLSIDDLVINENQGTATFTVTLDQAVQDGVSIDWSTADGTATAGTDYTAGSGTLNFIGNADETQTITVNLINDTTLEQLETFLVNLSNIQHANNADITIANQGQATIAGNDGPVVTLTGTAAADDFQLQMNADGVTLEVWNNTSLVFAELLANITDLNINGGAGADIFTVDLNNGLPFPSSTINFDGEADGGSIVLESSSYTGSLTTVTHTLNSDSAGSISVDGQLINYTSTDALFDNLVTTNRVFDFAGAAETITLSDTGTSNDGLSSIDSTLGAAVTFTGTASAVTISTTTGSGTDAINLEGLDSLNAGDFTVTGDTDDNVTFQTNNTVMGANDLTVIAQTITVDSAVSSTTGATSLTASRNIYLDVGSSLTTVDGGITLLANDGGTLAGEFIGIEAIDATIQSTGSGNISLTGFGGNGSGENNSGVRIDNGTISSTGIGIDAATITLDGRGGSGTNLNRGVIIFQADVSSIDGDISVTGFGGGVYSSDEHENHGVNLHEATLTSTGTGNNAAKITVNGTAGAGFNSDVASYIFHTDITSVDGAISLTGNGINTVGSYNYGLILHGGSVESTGTGTAAATITLNGTGGNGDGANIGVNLTTEAMVTTVDGDISLTGYGRGTGSNNYGVIIAGELSSTGIGINAGKITVNGTSSAGTSENQGIRLENSSVTSVDGDISFTGQGGAGTGISNIGVNILNSTITSTGVGINAATINIDGTGGTGQYWNYGVNLSEALTNVVSVDGAISITAADDFIFAFGASILSTTANVTITADAAAGNNNRYFLMTDDTTINAGSGTIQLYNDGSLYLSEVITSGLVVITSAAGSIHDNGDLKPDVVAGTAILNAYASVGESGNPLETHAFNLSGTGTTGGFHVNNSVYKRIIDDGEPGFSTIGAGWTYSSVSGHFQNDNYHLDPGSHLGESASWNFDHLIPGIYRISGYWAPHANRATNTTVTVSGISGGPISQTINQQYLSASLSDEGKNWQDIGFYHVDENGVISVTFTNENADGYVIADAMRIEKVNLVTVGDVTVDEDAGTATFTVTSHAPAGGAFSVDYATENGTAIAGSDYTATSGTLNFTGNTAGETQTVTVNLTDDNTIELDENFFLNISNVQTAGVANIMIVDSQGVGTIANDDTTVMSLANTNESQLEGDSGTTQFAFEVNISNPLDIDFHFWSRALDNTATEADGDFTDPHIGYWATIAAGATSTTVYYSTNGDTKLEDDEVFNYAFPRGAIFSSLSPQTPLSEDYLNNITFAGTDQSTLWATGTIINDDFVKIIDDGDAGFSTTGAGWTYHPVVGPYYYGDDSYYMSAGSNPGVTASWQFSDLPAGTYRVSSYWQTDPSRATNSEITVSGIVGGDATQTLNQQVLTADINDSGFDWQDLGFFTVDGNGTITVTIANESADGYVMADAMRIEKVDPVTVGDVTVDEDAGTATFTVTSHASAAGAFSVDYATANGTAIAGSDYTATSGTLNFTGTTAGETQTVTVNLTDDSTIELDESFFLNISNVQTAGVANIMIVDSQGLATIIDDEISITVTGTAAADDFLVQLNTDGVTLEVWNDTTLVYSGLLTEVTGLNIIGGAGADTFTVDLSNGLPFPVGTINLDGEADGGSLVLESGSYAGSLSTVTHTLNSDSAGSISVDGQLINYTSTDSLFDNLATTNRVFDFAGAAETITLSDTGTNNDGLSSIDSALGATVTFVTTAAVSIKTDSGSGTDAINVTGLDSLNAGDVTITGDSDDVVTFLTNTTVMGANNLAVTAQTITVDSSISSTSGAISLTASRNILLDVGSSLTTVDGGITLLANNGGAMAGDFIGIEADNATIQTTGTGNISVTGTGGAGTASANYGININHTTLSSTATGTDAATITISGTGGTGTSDNLGVFILDDSIITSVDGAIQLTGQGGNGSGAGNLGIMVFDGSEISSTGTGVDAATITVDGTAGTSTFLGHGVLFSSNAASVNSIDGNISIIGQGDSGSGSQHYGVEFSNAEIISSGTGANAATITIDGTGGGGVDLHRGIMLANSAISTIDGDLSLIGQGGGNGTNYHNQGIVLSQTSITSTGTGAEAAEISFHGIGGSGTASNDGFLATTLSVISSEVTNISIISEGNVWFYDNTRVESESGDLNLTSNYLASSNTGIFYMNTGTVFKGKTGNIDIDAYSDTYLTGLIAGGTVTVDSTIGSILDNGDTRYEVFATTAVLNALNSVGTSGNPLETNVVNLSGTGTNSGFHVNNSGYKRIIDNGDAGFSQTGSWYTYGGNPTFYQNDYSYVDGFGTGQNTSSWAFSNLQEGTYRLSGTWYAHAIRASNIPTTISGAVGGTVYTTINEELLSQDVYDDGVYWQDLGYFEVTQNGTITVTISDNGTNGNVLAEAFRIELVSPLLAAGGQSSTSAESITQEDLNSVRDAALSYWASAGLSETQLSLLQSVNFALADLPDGMLGGETSSTITIDINAAGYGWFVDDSPFDHSEFTLNADGSLVAGTNSAAFGKMDLLTVVMHELGHTLGYEDRDAEHAEDHLMGESLDNSIRRLPEIDDFFSSMIDGENPLLN